MKHELVTTDDQIADLCAYLVTARQIAFDTEFVSEDSFRPELCLIQVAADGRLAVIDPLKVRDLTPFWTALATGDHETVVHAGRQEVEFSLRTVGRPPQRLFDVQIAAGMIGLEYPANYGTLVTKMLGQTPDKGETRTDWRRRPLSDRQIAYALADVHHLAQLRDKLGQRLQRLERSEWFTSEMADWTAEIEAASGRERWRKVSGSSGLPPRGLAIVRELWAWRDSEAERRDCPVRRVLRDDLIVELARRRSVDPKQIRAIRGMERSDLARTIPDVAAAIGRALALPDSACPRHRAHRYEFAVVAAGPVSVGGASQHLPRGRSRPQHCRHRGRCPRIDRLHARRRAASRRSWPAAGAPRSWGKFWKTCCAAGWRCASRIRNPIIRWPSSRCRERREAIESVGCARQPEGESARLSPAGPAIVQFCQAAAGNRPRRCYSGDSDRASAWSRGRQVPAPPDGSLFALGWWCWPVLDCRSGVNHRCAVSFGPEGSRAGGFFVVRFYAPVSHARSTSHAPAASVQASVPILFHCTCSGWLDGCPRGDVLPRCGRRRPRRQNSVLAVLDRTNRGCRTGVATSAQRRDSANIVLPVSGRRARMLCRNYGNRR